MKTKFRVLSILLATAMLLSLLAGCGAKAPVETKAPVDTTASEGNTQTSAGTASAEEDFHLPICDELTTVTLFTDMDSNLANLVNNLNETDFFKELERRTNVHIEFDIPASGGETAAFNLLFSSGELPDMIKNMRPGYPGGLDAAVDDGFYMDLTDLIPKYAPHYYAALMSQDPSVLRTAYTGTGRLACVSQLMQTSQGPWAGLYVRKDWLDQCGLEVPVTYDDWEKMLTAFKEECGAPAPMLLYKTGYDSVFNTTTVGYGVTAAFHQENGVVKFGPYEEGWKKYVTTMHDWYEKGLIDPDFMSSSTPTSYLPDQAMITTGKCGAFEGMYTMASVFEQASTDPNAVMLPVYPPMETADMKNDFLRISAITAGISISADSDKAEICLKLLDYFFTEEGALFANYGIEGDTFEFVDGKPQYTEKITNNPDLTFGQAMAFYTMPAGRVVWQDWTRETASVPAKDLISYDIWGNATSDKSIVAVANLGMDPDAYTEYSTIMADVQTIVDEKTAQFISGVISLDEYDNYLKALKSVNVERAIELVQQAYDDFMAR